MTTLLPIISRLKPLHNGTLYNNIVHHSKINATQRLCYVYLRLNTENGNAGSLAEYENQKKRAIGIKLAASLRVRCAWPKEEDEKLLRLVEEHGPRWTFVSKLLVDRTPSSALNRYRLLQDQYRESFWSKEELTLLAKWGAGRTYDQIDNWEEVQKLLPTKENLYGIKQKYKKTLDPSVKHGRWSKEESDQLERLVQSFGEDNMDRVANMMGSRTKSQCLERWRWQMSETKKGHFSPEEDERILKAVKEYGENFGVVCQVANLDRTPRHVSQHYRNVLDPSIDRSSWSPEEEIEVYKACLANDKDMIKTKRVLGSNRAIRDMWNRFYKVKRKEDRKTRQPIPPVKEENAEVEKTA